MRTAMIAIANRTMPASNLSIRDRLTGPDSIAALMAAALMAVGGLRLMADGGGGGGEGGGGGGGGGGRGEETGGKGGGGAAGAAPHAPPRSRRRRSPPRPAADGAAVLAQPPSTQRKKNLLCRFQQDHERAHAANHRAEEESGDSAGRELRNAAAAFLLRIHRHERRRLRRFRAVFGLIRLRARFFLRRVAGHAAVRARVDLRELRAEEEDLRGPVDPHQQNHERAGGAVRRAEGGLAEIEREAELAEDEEDGGEERAEPDVAPFRMGVRQEAEDRGEEDGDEREGNEELHRLQERLAAGEAAVEIAAHRRDHCVENEADEQQETGAEDHRDREEARFDEAEDAARFLRRHVPDRVERVLQLHEHARRAEDERHDADDRRERAGLRFVRRLEHRFNSGCGLATEQTAELAGDFLVRRFAPERESGDGHRDQEQRRDREDRVVRERGAETRGFVLAEFFEGLFEKSQILAHVTLLSNRRSIGARVKGKREKEKVEHGSRRSTFTFSLSPFPFHWRAGEREKGKGKSGARLLAEHFYLFPFTFPRSIGALVKGKRDRKSVV